MKRSLLLTLLASFMFAGSLHAATDFLLEIDGIKGESKDETHKDSIEILSFSWGASNAGASGGGQGKVIFQDLLITTKLSRATPQLLLKCADGTHIPKAVLFVRKPDGNRNEFYKVTMEDVLVSSLKQTARGTNTSATSDSFPLEEVSLNYGAISIEYTAEDGTVTTGRAVRTPIQ